MSETTKCGDKHFWYTCDMPKRHPGRVHRSLEPRMSWSKEGPVWATPGVPESLQPQQHYYPERLR